MEVITIETKIWKALNDRLENMERMLFSIVENPEAPPARISSGRFITIEETISKYRLSRTAINNKAKKYGIERQRCGRQNLINEQEFIDSLKHKEPKPAFFMKK